MLSPFPKKPVLFFLNKSYFDNAQSIPKKTSPFLKKNNPAPMRNGLSLF